MQPDDDEAWRSIVDHYGDRIDLEPDDEPAPPPPEPAASPRDAGTWDDPDADWTTDRFVPPAPPPIPVTTRERYLAWGGLIGAPAALLVLLLLGVSLPSWGPLLLVAAFVAGFVYLVLKMPREPRDPGDDGAVL